MQFKSLFVVSLATGIFAAPTLPVIDGNTANGLLKDLNPDVQRLLIALGLGSLAPGVGGALNTVGSNVKEKRDAAAAPAPAAAPAGGLLNDLNPDVQRILAAIGLGSLAPGVGGTLSTVGNNVKSKRALLADLSPDVQRLLIAIGLGSLAPGVGGALTSVGNNV